MVGFATFKAPIQSHRLLLLGVERTIVRLVLSRITKSALLCLRTHDNLKNLDSTYIEIAVSAIGHTCSIKHTYEYRKIELSCEHTN